MKTYEDGLWDGAENLERANIKATPYKVTKAVNSIPFGMEPMYKVCAYFSDKEDAEEFIQSQESKEAKGNKRYLYRLDVQQLPPKKEDDEVQTNEE